jgi:hypothetical protein
LRRGEEEGPDTGCVCKRAAIAVGCGRAVCMLRA